MKRILSLVVVLALLSSVIGMVPMPVMAAAESEPNNDFGYANPISLDESGARGQPDITVSPASFDVTLPPNTTQSHTLTIGNDGSADLTYDISDRETASGQPQTKQSLIATLRLMSISVRSLTLILVTMMSRLMAWRFGWIM